MCILTGKAHGASARRATSASNIGISQKIKLLPFTLNLLSAFGICFPTAFFIHSALDTVSIIRRLVESISSILLVSLAVGQHMH